MDVKLDFDYDEDIKSQKGKARSLSSLAKRKLALLKNTEEE